MIPSPSRIRAAWSTLISAQESPGQSLLSRSLLGLAAVLVVGCSSSPDKRLLQYLNTSGFGKDYVGNAEEENYVSLGDTIVMSDLLHPDELALTQQVQVDGTVLLPYVGPTHVAGYTRNELQALFTEKYSPYYDETDIQVQISTQGKVYWIFGEVNGDGEQKFDGDLTIWEAVMDSGPDEFKANLGRVRLIRPDPIDPFILTVNIDDIMRRGDSTNNVKIKELDIIYVPPTFLGQVGYFIQTLLRPVTDVVREISSAIFGLNFQGGRFNGGRRRGRRGQNNAGLLF